MAPPFLTSTLDGGQLHATTALPPWKSPMVPIGEEDGWVAEPVRKVWRKGKSCTARDRTRAVQPVARR
jgi:hypothetical protein